ncbi:MAG: hypothetical protein [Inoviridae sp.]|nr:MAG: hypothetical protein [Inoviridae sp.]
MHNKRRIVHGFLRAARRKRRSARGGLLGRLGIDALPVFRAHADVNGPEVSGIDGFVLGLVDARHQVGRVLFELQRGTANLAVGIGDHSALFDDLPGLAVLDAAFRAGVGGGDFDLELHWTPSFGLVVGN